ncbi:UvrD-helicase domain-containing protein [uncultured Jatrophihabitans sp.]|uniref:UvrD-helicase domain-containing protein n=1 Tax=uncultured Jatrophihabitans sp. TaxID=1610747 RepID=UPI0035CAC8EB
MTAVGAAARTIGATELAERLGLHPPTPEQAAVIESELAPSVVIAGAGSGKTETMAARVVWLVANRVVSPDAVLGLTFTRKAAAELGRRIRRRLAQWRGVVERDQPDDVEYLTLLRAAEPTVSTYAAYAGRLVGEHALRLGAEPDARLMTQAAAWQLADQVMRNHPGELPDGIGALSSVVRYLLQMSGQFADHLVDVDGVDAFCAELEAFVDGLPGKRNKTGEVADLVRSLAHRRALLPLVRAFSVAKAGRSAMDFGDQMSLAARLAPLEEVRSVERARFGAVLLDEYQDTGHAQIEMLHGLFGDGHPVTAVGDPFQSIYGWRGASAGNIGAFAHTFTRAGGARATVYPLATSFRNDRIVLGAANAVADPLRTVSRAGTVTPLRPGPTAADGQLRVAFTETHAAEATWLAGRMSEAWSELPEVGRTAAVLVRRRSQIPIIADALRAEGLPVEVVGLGGLLTTPEVSDVVATLRVLAGFTAGSSLARLLTGARWRIGPYDLAALHRRARRLSRNDLPVPIAVVEDAAGTPGPAGAEDEPVSLIEALDDLGPEQHYSTEGYRRLSAFSTELHRLRRRVGYSLPELIAEVERVSGVDIEVLARPDHAVVGRVHLDRFLDEAVRFVNDAGDASTATLSAFLAFLDAAEDEENGLEAGEVEVATERVQILTVHGAKGLEWDIVSVPGLDQDVFPAQPKTLNWARARQQIPVALRGDAGDLPALTLAEVADTGDLKRVLIQHDADLKRRHDEEERRLAYVALTRARHVLLASGYVFDDAGAKARKPSDFLLALRDFAEPDEWFEPADDAINPVTGQAAVAGWPIDPLAPRDPTRPSRRADVEWGAALVAAARADHSAQPEQLLLGEPITRAEVWRRDVEVLLAERARLAGADAFAVELPDQLSVSQLVELQRDPSALARALRRPLPRPPAPWARRGTAFHTWLEQRWKSQTLLDIDELPGAADEDADDADFDELRAAFERSDFAARTPADVEVPFEMTVAGRVIRGRMDAVFGDAADGWLVVDWKTGTRPTGTAAQAAAVQLAAYRLAWARLNGISDVDLGTVRAAFHYVRSNETVEPAALLDADGLRALVAGEPEAR